VESKSDRSRERSASACGGRIYEQVLSMYSTKKLLAMGGR